MRGLKTETPPDSWQASGGEAKGIHNDSEIYYTPNLAEAQRHLTLLDENAESFTFQTFADTPDAKAEDAALEKQGRPKRYAAIRHGTLDQWADWLVRKNKDGAGVFVTVNETDFSGRRKSNIQRIRAVWQEDDNGDAKQLPLEPHITVESSPGKYHRYLLVDGAPLVEFEPVQQRLVDNYGSDPNAKDRPRVLRLAGFYHLKNPDRPHMVRVVDNSGAQPYSWETITKKFPPVEKKPGKSQPGSAGEDQEYEAASGWAKINRKALLNPTAWFTELFPDAYQYHDGFRVSSNSLGRSLEEDISLADGGIMDFGEQRGKSALDLVLEWGPANNIKEAAQWLCERLGVDFAQIMGTRPSPRNQACSPAAKRLAKQITKRLTDHLAIAPDDSDGRGAISADPRIVQAMIDGCFWSGSKGKFFFLNEEESLVMFSEKDAWQFMRQRFGSPVDHDAITDAVKNLDFGCNSDDAEHKAKMRHIASAKHIAGDVVKDHLKYHNQREAMEWRCDMFADHPRMDIVEDKARIVLTHKPIIGPAQHNPGIIADYKQHFPRFDEFLTFLVMSRFAPDRKKAYLWILAESDWGKNFLIEGVLGYLRLTVFTSTKEVEAMFEGRAIGRSPEDFKRAYALVIDEFKTVKSELKQLQSEIQLAPKYQLTATVEVFAKVFMSAESVASLVTENGVEDQFANRMSIFEERGALTERGLFQQVGKPQYLQSIRAYAAQQLEQQVQVMRSKERGDAEMEADQWLTAFCERYGLGTRFERFSESLPRVAGEVVQWLLRSQHPNVIKDDFDADYLLSPRRTLDEYLEEHFDRSEIGAYQKRKADILRLMSADEKGVTSHRVRGEAKKCVLLTTT